MSLDHILVWAIVGVAALYLLRGFWGRKKGGACGGGCHGCGTTPQTGEKPAGPALVQLEVKPRRPEPKGPPERPTRRSPFSP